MARQKMDKETKKNILKARKWIEDIAQKDANEAETRKRIYDICETLMGYRDEHISWEYEIPTAGENVRCDLAILIDQNESSKPNLLVEVKKVNMDLVKKHVGQAAHYAIDIGCKWVLLTNGREWKLYYVSSTQTSQTKPIAEWNLIEDKPLALAKKFGLICYKSIRKDSLKKLWDTYNVLTPLNLLKIILSEQSIKSLRSKLKKATQVAVSPEEIVGAIRDMLNETAGGEMEKVRISLPAKKQRKTASSKTTTNEEENKQEV